MLRIRMVRGGRTNRAHFRIGVYDQRSRRNGPCIEKLGHYDPHNDSIGVQINADRLAFHLGNGAQLSEKCAALLKKHGVCVTHPAPGKRKPHKRARKAPQKKGA